MKFFWPILLICIFFCQAEPNTKKVAKVLHLMKRYSQLTKLERKLEDITDVPTDDEGSQNSTNGTVDEPTKNINASEATKDMYRNTDNPNANYHIRKFYGFRQERDAVWFYFNMIFSYIGRRIGRLIRMRLLILYNTNRLRNLEEPLAQSVTSNCTIIDGSKVGDTGNGEDIDYSCLAPKESGKEVSNVNLDTTVKMDIDGDEVGFDNVYFEKEAAEQADNITAATGGRDSGTSNTYRKSSSGLSGGAIAGIVIACVAVLIAAAVAAIMLRKPSPPIENTTVVDLKQDNI